MQDIRSVGGGSAGVRRLRVAGNHTVAVTNLNSHHGALKCPRCDSLNTKFCYYNNYNLSQPRHFCKSCRRYWTNGGVLRNVPVGGGCRKSKRSSTKATVKRHHRSPSPAATAPPPPPPSNSSSESSSLTAVDAVSSGLTSIGGVPLHQGGITGPSGAGFDQPTIPLFPEMNAGDTGLNFGFHSLLMNQNQQPRAMPWVGAAELEDDQKDNLVGFFDWQGSCGGAGSADQSLFDLSINSVDNSFWSQAHWNNTTITGGDHLDHQDNLFLL